MHRISVQNEWLRERREVMTAMKKQDYEKVMTEQKKEVRDMVTKGIDQIKMGKTKDFKIVCERLEKKYRDATISD